MKTGKLIVTLACLVAVGASLGACREDEQGRVLLFKKGVYLGKADTPISDEARRAMRSRMSRQAAARGLGGGAGAGAGSSLGRPPDVRPPSAKANDAMRQRARRQSGN
jgi:hypothetical protein